MSFKKVLEIEKNLSVEDRVRLNVTKRYINHLDGEYLNDVVYPIVCTEGDLEDELLDAHHLIIANMLRDVNRDVFNGDEECTFAWMEKELTPDAYENFGSMDFNIK